MDLYQLILGEVQGAGDPREDIGYTGSEQSKNYNDNDRNQNDN